jgi:hypothetical protein
MLLTEDKQQHLINVLACLCNSAVEGHSDDCAGFTTLKPNLNCQLCLDLLSAHEILEEVDKVNDHSINEHSITGFTPEEDIIYWKNT